MKRLVLGVSGSVAAYRACDLARELMRAGFEVRVCLTEAAEKFVTPALFEALTGQPCLIGAFEEPERGRMAHIDWAREASLVLVAPASANTLNKLAQGVGDDMLTTLALASTAPLVLAPAMNPAMWAHPTTQESLARLIDRGARVVEPGEGVVACGEQGQGKFAALDEIVDAVEEAAFASRRLAGKRVLITNGPTQEPLDDVRFLTNRSSGKMGAALARAAGQMGGEVTVVSGPVSVSYPAFARVLPVQTASEMLAVALECASEADLIIGVAAVADYRPKTRVEGKIRREGPLALELEPNPDIIAALAEFVASRRQETWPQVVAFGAEPSSDPEVAVAKMIRKGVDALAMNDISAPGIGFGSDSNALTLLRPDQAPLNFGPASKFRCAIWLLEQLT
ncbi:MAG TPA: bifunctional phosphopantothenoylcysteine decarboxylase/phosphopantothenate--cysteine ligase CoaBC [Fimbriimonadaceae bacterium]|nr:bifunctional phosphopantothenoylcysteine decarboxylase/phosphopantothenate--cysteine ligase CoaBC [Fimbriimonadaceae bacterium]HRJ32509.1 bifunctional phosphopantothenoylcysteine decarboxylase/phosphopantothenate--cysteine ligase CoaBC [Fimbriimonadaceae bacterium]